MRDGLRNNITDVSGKGPGYILLFISLPLIILNLHLWLSAYEEFSAFWTAALHVPGNSDKITQVFGPDRYQILRIHSLVFGLISISLLVYVFRKPFASSMYRNPANLLHSVFQDSLNNLKALSGVQKMILYSAFAVFMGRNILLLFYLPFDVDEIWSYMAFRNKNPLFALLWYPIPGNHIFYTFLSQLFLRISPDFHYLIRLPALLCSALSFFTLFLLLNKIFRFRIAIAGLMIFYSFSPVIYYSVAARGYSVNILCSIVLLGSLYRILLYNDRRFIFIGVIASALGIYAIPTFAYNLVSALVCWLIFIVFYKISDLRTLASFFLGTLLLSYLLYLPVFLFSGYSAVFKNDYVVSKSVSEVASAFSVHYSDAASWLISGNPADIFLIMASIIAGIVFMSFTGNWQYRLLLLFSSVLLVMPYSFSLIQRVLIPAGILTYTCLGLSLIVLYFLQMLSEKARARWNPVVIISMIILIIAPLNLYFKDYYEERFYRYHHAMDISEFLDGKAQKYFFNDTYYPYIFEFQMARYNKLQTLSLTNEPAAADMIAVWKNYGFFDMAGMEKDYVPVYEDTISIIYKKIKP